MTRPGKALSLSTTNCVEMGKLMASSMRDHHCVSDRSRPRTQPGDHTKPSVLDVLFVGCRLGLPPVLDWARTVAPPFFGSFTVIAELVVGEARLKSVGGLNAVARAPRSSRRSTGRSSNPTCPVVFEPKSL